MTDTATSTATDPKLYVGTYGKYNDGSIAGAWLDLRSYRDEDEFLAKCRDLHKDERDPEFMFQDYEGFPRALYRESSIDERLFEFVQYDDDDQSIITDFLDNVDGSASLEDALSAYEGMLERDPFQSVEDAYGHRIVDDGALEVPDNVQSYIDYEAVGRDFMQDVTITDEGRIFSMQ